MTLPEFALAYKKCNKDELRQFIGDRTGQLPPKSRKKSQLIDKLEKLDSAATFAFMDLPPELRTMVYREVVSLKSPEDIEAEENMNKKARSKNGHQCYVGILATNSIVHSEAKDVMYGEQEVTVKLAFPHTYECLVHFYDSIHLTSTFCEHEDGHVWVDYLRRMRYLRICVDFDNVSAPPRADFDGVYKMANRLLYGLVTHVSTSDQVKHVAVHLSLGSAENCMDTIRSMLWPLARLTKTCNFSVTGTHADDKIASIAAYLTSTGAPTSTYKSMNQYYSLLRRAKAFKEVKKDVSIWVPGNFEGRYEQLRCLVQAWDYVNDIHEQMLIFAMKKLEETLEKDTFQRCMHAAFQKAERLHELSFEMMDEEDLAETLE